MTDEYVEQRRRYVQEVRNSFSDMDAKKQKKSSGLFVDSGWESEEETDLAGNSAIWKVKLILSVMLFAAFVLCDRTGTKLFSMETDTIVEKISQNQKLPQKAEETLKYIFPQMFRQTPEELP